MLTVKELKPNVYELTLKGVVDKTDIETMERELTPALKGDGPLSLILRAEEWRDITADAMAADMRFEFGLLPQWAKIARMAVVTDLQAFEALMRWVDPIVPMIHMRSFPASEAAAAEAFASDLPDRAAAADGSGIRLLSDGSDGLVAFEVTGRITKSDVDAVFAPLEDVMQGDRKVGVLAKFNDWDGFDPGLFTDAGGMMGSKMGMAGHMTRYAVVGAPGWMRGMVSAMAPMMPFEMRSFEASDAAQAEAWARAG
ncbi:STAS/SEC14 domain-containing protein [uncultured Jannaschia sp.]|uniref:STAS/SEC14 domain-containing protein n=1 Tax=uncultured Jannaschia sp. TaxID=293347 RepID=UPI0026253787|nr:STAS/SEC14 domain-containing protein [uncultured Jannaschia sp.]